MGSKRKRGAGSSGPQDIPKRTKDENDSSANASKKIKTKTNSKTKTKPTFEKSPFVEAPIGDERKREAGLYELLGSEDANDRIEAADCIISSLFGDEGVSEAVLQRHLDRRLFRGLSSGRNASRLGFSLVLTELIGQMFGEKNLAESKYPNLTFDKVLEILTEKIQTIGNIPGQEERDHFFGQLFGIESFVRAGILFRDISRWNTILDLLLKLASKKVWLRSQCGWVIVQSIEQMNKKQVEATLEKVSEANLAKTPEGVAIWLVALNKFSDLKVKPWRDPLSKKSFGDLAAVLRESFQDFSKDQPERAQKNKQTSWTAQLHYVWDLLLAHYIKSGEAGAGDFQQFWARVVDDSLFAKSATEGQKFKGFMVFQKMLEGLVDLPDHLEGLFSKNLTLCLMNQAAKEDRYLHRAATKALKAIESTTSAHPSTLVPILKSLLGENGAYNFDQRTNTKTIDRVLQNVSGETGEKAIDIIRKPLGTIGQQETAQAISTLRVYIDYLSKTLNASASSASGKIQQNVFSAALQELSQLAYSQPKHIPADALTEGVRELCRTRLESSFAKVSRRTEDYGTLCLAVSSIDSNTVAMSEEIKNAVQEALSRMQKLLKRKTTDDNEKSLFQSLAMLHAVSVFQLYNEDPDAMEVLNDLAQYSERLKKGKSAESEAGTSELLVEILLSMVARPSSLMRQVSQQVFDAFTPQISAGGLELLTGPLSSGESTKGQKELFSTGEDEMEVDEDEDDEEGTDADEEDNSDIEIDSDVEFVDINEANDENEDDDDDDDEDEEDDGKDGVFDKPEELDDALEKLLNTHRLDKDAAAESSESEGDMSDSEMFAIDEQLAAAIKPRIQDRTNDAKKQKKEAKQSVVNFKHRILDLVGIYVRNEALNSLSFAFLLPLLNLMRTTTTKPLAGRACEIILNYQKALRKARSNRQEIQAPESDELMGLLLEVHEAAGQDNSHAYAKAASAASLIIVSALFAADKSKMRDVAVVYAKTQSDCVLGEAKLQSSFFADWHNWCQNAASQTQS
ncbi:DNA polymerase V [Fusarium heterosporum]|uniref:DNA polymerase V n=1 Tax=Fusarium heterosporum TaxID=42747 RepID=A0A8H5T4C5_FUSHE|nr:DNA polymerase V [Fusarium heterosporum]